MVLNRVSHHGRKQTIMSRSLLLYTTIAVASSFLSMGSSAEAATFGYNSSTRELSVYSNDSLNDEAYEAAIASGGWLEIRVRFNGPVQYRIRAYRVARIKFYGDGQRDEFENQTSKALTAWGGAGNDLLIGGSGRDYLYGQEGEDYLRGSDNNDFLDCGSDYVEAVGGDGYDTHTSYLFFGYWPQSFAYGTSSIERTRYRRSY